MKDETGNALFIILIAVALLAALSFAVSKSGRGTVDILTSERARLGASEILEFSDVVANAVGQTRLRGYSDTQISFKNDVAVGYANGNCGDTICQVFHVDGGGVSYLVPPVGVMGSSPAPDNLWHIYGDNEIEDIGTTCGVLACADLILMVDELGLSVCQQINRLLGVGVAGAAPPTDTSFGETLFVGAYGYSATIGDEAASLAGVRAACFQKTGAPAEYAFYRVLIAR